MATVHGGEEDNSSIAVAHGGDSLTYDSDTASIASIALSSNGNSPRNTSFLSKLATTHLSPQTDSSVPQYFDFSGYKSSKKSSPTSTSPAEETLHLDKKEAGAEGGSEQSTTQRREVENASGRTSVIEDSHSHVFDTDADSQATRATSLSPTPDHSMAGSSFTQVPPLNMSYPPPPFVTVDPEAASTTSSMISYARKDRPESLIIDVSSGPLILGVVLVDFNHLVGPQIEWSEGLIFEDEEVRRMLPFLALPDGAHLNSEDYSYFHIVPPSPTPKTCFGISCNRQIESATLLVRGADVTRPTVQKAIVVVASKPIFGPIRDKLGVVTRAYFAQRDFSDTTILSDFHSSLETDLRTKLTESAFYMGTNLRALIHTFRHRVLVLLKALMIQKKIMFHGHPVELLCTYQYSLASLVPGLLQNLEDCGSPPLAARASTLKQAESLKMSDRKSLLNYLGLPLDLFGQDSFFQPYLPLQQVDLLDAESVLCGVTNDIILQRPDIHLKVNIADVSIIYNISDVEKLVSLTPADRVWIDEIVRDVNDTWNEAEPSRPANLQFRGSEDYIRTKFEDYVTSALSHMKYKDYLRKGGSISGNSASDANQAQHFNPLWLQSLKDSRAFEVWDRVTDPTLFDIAEPRHPGATKASTIADIGLRLQEGFHDLKLQQQLGPTKEALSTALASGSTSFFKAVDGMRDRWGRRPSANSIQTLSQPSTSTEAQVHSGSSSPLEISKSDIEDTPSPPASITHVAMSVKEKASPVAAQVATRASSWGSGIGSFISNQSSRFGRRSVSRTSLNSAQTPTATSEGTTPNIESIAVAIEPIKDEGEHAVHGAAN